MLSEPIANTIHFIHLQIYILAFHKEIKKAEAVATKLLATQVK